MISSYRYLLVSGIGWVAARLPLLPSRGGLFILDVHVGSMPMTSASGFTRAYV